MNYEINVSLDDGGFITVSGVAASAEEVREIARKLKLELAEEATETESPKPLKVGDRVRVVKGCKDCYFAGDIAVIVRDDRDGTFYADFNGQGNPRVEVDGFWWVDTGRVEVIE